MSFPAFGATVPTLTAGQMSFNGTTFGGIHSPPSTAFPYQVQMIEGLDLPAMRTGDSNRPRFRGSIAGQDVLGPRAITAKILITADATSLDHAKRALAGILAVQGAVEYPFYVQLPGGSTYGLLARARRWSWVYDVNYQAGGYVPVQVAFQATDPTIYSTPTQQTTLSPAAVGTGLTFPASPNFTFQPGVGPNVASITNSGDLECFPLVVLNGPLTSPTVTNGVYSLTVQNPTNPGTVDVASGDQVLVDMDTHSVIYYYGGINSGGATANARSWVTGGSTFWSLPPGASTVRLGSADVSDTGTVLIQWASAFSSI